MRLLVSVADESRSEVRFATIRRCPHTQGHDVNPWDTDGSDAEYQIDQERDQPRFVHLKNDAKILLRRLKNGQLRGFG
jgi:hypothetical protein